MSSDFTEYTVRYIILSSDNLPHHIIPHHTIPYLTYHTISYNVLLYITYLKCVVQHQYDLLVMVHDRHLQIQSRKLAQVSNQE